jgi:SAM-dependent methyltransferase
MRQDDTGITKSASDFFEKLVLDLMAEGFDTKLCSLLIAEAKYGLDLIKDLLQPGVNLRILEIGSGISALSYFLATLGHEVHALEPIHDEFEYSREIMHYVLKKTMNVKSFFFHDSKIQDFGDHGIFDLIFSINTFEHLDSIDGALEVISASLPPDGVALIAFSNGHFPYEPHYGIPIIGSRNLTYRLFYGRIQEYDRQYESGCVWENLNFITSSKFASISKQHGLIVVFDKIIMEKMLLRMLSDQEFALRHRHFVSLVKLFTGLHLHRIIRFIPLFLHPYCSALLTKEAINV